MLSIIHPQFSAMNDNLVAPLLERKHAYRSLCLDLADWSGSLDFLLFVSPQKPLSAPSWVVQWHQPDTLWATYLYRNDPSWSDASPILCEAPTATPGSSPRYAWDPRCGHELRVQAVFITTIGWKAHADPWAAMRERRAIIEQHMMDRSEASDFSRGWRQKRNVPAYAGKDDRAVVQTNRLGHRRDFSLAPHDVRIEDHVALISGLSMPIVLRGLEHNTWRIVGPAFLPGMMNGEAWTAEIEKELQQIVLI